LRLVEAALQRRPLGPYQLQAAIAAVHAEAKTAQETDWRQIARLYEKLLEFNNSAVVALNHAAAVAMSGALAQGLKLMDNLDLDRYYLFHAARADILRRMNRPAEAMEAYRKALALATNRVEQEFLERRLSTCLN
jgi:RNA polymerase sigma-70 factor (ECF subfamily)